MSLERFCGDSALKQKVMYTKSHGNQEANIESWKNDRNSVFSYKQPAVFWHLKKGRYLEVDVAISCFISELYLQMDCLSHAKGFDQRLKTSLKTSELHKETWAVWPKIKALTWLASLLI